MTLWQAVGRQLRHPSGAGGRLAGRLMRLANARPNALAVAALGARPGETVLELGCGPGQAVALLARNLHGGTILGLDQSEAMLAQARAANRAAVAWGRVRLCRARFEALPLASASVDRVLAINVAYFWQDAGAVLGEVRRVLRPGGTLLVYVTDAASMRRWKFADPETHRLYDRAALSTLLESGGFRPEMTAVFDLPVLPGVTGLIARARKGPAVAALDASGLEARRRPARDCPAPEPAPILRPVAERDG
ncbi:Methyltransferase domain-containing protein [Tistlia consotensis]|uniref:Methyltransferase domain-containing protein n=1 Tax=Tistlia consotensis USBA 355 TaxID=560819 RepID=A0A1Y6CG82_9PROT|nr:class I SAM-dependent methyltransferase [Tistlia consotensis]SMF60204.1 Methyltransferase domain-containing protein [Tistlia consotensis USBA 355]SNR93721.1 Methyltransferase domain-containing protein [Tistlia consotensis]